MNPRRWVIAAVVAVAAAGLALLLSNRAEPVAAGSATRDVTGTLALTDGVYTVAGTTVCSGSGGYDDIAEGTTVTVTDATGKVIGVTALRAGKLNTASGVCELPWRADDIPTGRGFYGFEVSHRGVVRFAEADLEGAIRLTLG